MLVKPFDYMFAPDGSIYVIRAVAEEWVIARLIYRKISQKNYTKIKAGFFEDDFSDKAFALGDWGDRVFTMDLVKPLRKRRFARPISSVLQEIGLEHLNASPFSVDWFGSRSVGLSHENSDYDLILEGWTNPRKWLEEHMVSRHEHIRFFSRAEHEVRIERYLANNSFVSVEKLLDLLDISSIYLWVGELEVGVFYRNPGEVCKAYSMCAFHNIFELETIEGVIRGCGGLSFNMPRVFALETDVGEVQIYHTVWLLSGIEMLEGKTLRIEGAFRLGPFQYAITPRFSTLYWE